MGEHKSSRIEILSRAVARRGVLHLREAATLLGVSRATAYRAVTQGTLPALRFGRTVRIPTAALLRLLQVENSEE